jgi:hypothetical protein
MDAQEKSRSDDARPGCFFLDDKRTHARSHSIRKRERTLIDQSLRQLAVL